MMFQVLLVYADTQRYITVKQHSLTKEVDYSYARLEQEIRNIFKIPSDVELVLTYKDREDDVVTISKDKDLKDSIEFRANPLRIDVKNVEDKQGENKGEKREGRSSSEKDKEACSSSAQENLSLVDMLEKALLFTFDSLKNMGSDQLSNLSERLEQHGTLQAKLLSEVLQVFTKANFKDSKGKSNSEDQGFEFSSSPKEAAGSKEAEFSDPAADFCQFANGQAAPNPCQGSFQGHRRHHTDEVFHHGVQCNLCGIVPIAGPRYKSNKKEDYDLCLNCFSETRASEADYTRYDQPLKHCAGGNLSSFHWGKTVVSKDEQSPQILESLKSDTEQNHQCTHGEAPNEDGEDVVVEEILEKAFMECMVNSSHFDVNVEGPSAPLVDLVDGEIQKNVKADVEKYLEESFVNENAKMENSELGAFSLVDIPIILSLPMHQ